MKPTLLCCLVCNKFEQGLISHCQVVKLQANLFFKKTSISDKFWPSCPCPEVFNQNAIALSGSNSSEETPSIAIRNKESNVTESNLDLCCVLIRLIRLIQLKPLSQQAVDIGRTSRISINIKMLTNLSGKSVNISRHTTCFLRCLWLFFTRTFKSNHSASASSLSKSFPSSKLMEVLGENIDFTFTVDCQLVIISRPLTNFHYVCSIKDRVSIEILKPVDYILMNSIDHPALKVCELCIIILFALGLQFQIHHLDRLLKLSDICTWPCKKST